MVQVSQVTGCSSAYIEGWVDSKKANLSSNGKATETKVGVQRVRHCINPLGQTPSHRILGAEDELSCKLRLTLVQLAKESKSSPNPE